MTGASLIVLGFAGSGATCIASWGSVRLLGREPLSDVVLAAIWSTWMAFAFIGLRQLGLYGEGWRGYVPLVMLPLGVVVVAVERRLRSADVAVPSRLDQGSAGVLVFGLASWAVAAFAALAP